jgi:hypothetical protein
MSQWTAEQKESNNRSRRRHSEGEEVIKASMKEDEVERVIWIGNLPSSIKE